MISTESAVIGLSPDDVDMNKVKQLKQRPDLIKDLDAWILSPDRDLIPRMQELAALVNSLYTHPKVLTLYRGFDLGSYQDSMGLKTLPHVGQSIQFDSEERALSFSTEINIARAFGGTVVAVQLNTAKAHFLDITPELCYLVCEERNLDNHETQKEVLVLPPFDLQGTVVQAKRHNFGWAGW